MDSDGLANDSVSEEVNTHAAEVVYFDINNLVWQTELRNAIFEYSANLVKSLKDINLVAFFYHVAGEGQTRWS